MSKTDVAEELELRDPIDFVLLEHTKMRAEFGMAFISSKEPLYMVLK